jgi:hypothetical protein
MAEIHPKDHQPLEQKMQKARADRGIRNNPKHCCKTTINMNMVMASRKYALSHSGYPKNRTSFFNCLKPPERLVASNLDQLSWKNMEVSSCGDPDVPQIIRSNPMFHFSIQLWGVPNHD